MSHNAFTLFVATAWAPHAVPDLEDWVRKLAAISSYDERKWRELSRGKWEAKHHGIGDVSEMRPAPPEEMSAPSISKSGKDNKRKRASKPEESQDEVAPARKSRKKLTRVDPDSAIQYPEVEENDGGESTIVPRTGKPIEAAKPSELEITPRGEGTPKKDLGKAPVLPEIEIVPLPSINIPEGESEGTLESNQNAPSEELGAMTTGHSLSLPSYSEEAIEDSNALRMPDPSKVLGEDPFHGCYAGIEDTSDLNDGSTIFKEAIVKFSAELSQCEAELRKVCGEEEALRLLCNQKEEELRDFRAELAKAQKNEAELDEQLQQKLEMIGQLRGEVDQVKADCHRKIEELEAELAGAQAEAARAKAEVEKTRATADKAIAVYLRDVAAIEAELREASDRERRSNDLAKWQARRETLEEIHAQGFDLTEEIAEAKVQETDARFLVSSDDIDVVSGSECGEGEEGVTEEEEALENRASEGAVPEEAASGDVTPK
ncbi:PREDICTED: uncharacterized abhydrolase domain-containing protein DDB_G0269086-like [Nicotiana attenuata]|uniref:uncharacterized abhydrolase domain-containing protein DDB_G0269086-like n=1 Tax=Nicotiana attenuata TaxID=49451 RepID=UPI000904856C|nr:PREDICTED: uncharacterized abhydrolase domain-containing protein DDB_G0269086-like [Nicotiana attenuata]